jgi:hypothetical protein
MDHGYTKAYLIILVVRLELIDSIALVIGDSVVPVFQFALSARVSVESILHHGLKPRPRSMFHLSQRVRDRGFQHSLHLTNR